MEEVVSVVWRSLKVLFLLVIPQSDPPQRPAAQALCSTCPEVCVHAVLRGGWGSWFVWYLCGIF